MTATGFPLQGSGNIETGNPMRKTQAMAALLLAASLAGCGSSSRREAADLSKATYQKDDRTGLCFATVGYTKGSWFESMFGVSNGFTITWVPREPKVLEAIASGG